MRHTLFCVGSVLVSLLLAAISLRYVTHTWLLAFVYSFQVHFALAALAASLVLILIRRHWYAYLLVTVSVLLAGHGVLMLKEFEATPPATASRPLLRLMSFNIENNNFQNSRRIAETVMASGADVVTILESAPLLPELPRISATYPYRIGCSVGTPGCDTLVLSKRPFIDQAVRTLGDLWPNRLAQVTIDVEGTPVHLASVHLAKPYFDDFQLDELWDLRGIVKKVDGPLVVAGDFNSAIIDPHIQDFVRATGLNTVFPEPATWPTQAGKFGISIDHILTRPPLRLVSVKQITDSAGSNHYGLMAEIAIDR
ncbi:endonuclease/exonuclease/phosphatase family protein [Rhizobium sp. 2MFCol3.1]|uniref:endonuclease/exonuclease/phosphatase family protein n=1 Tax=Rhizobium sp. 2MFCol3.1 TaxID=1246459 RepID=UPI0004760C30|nr:endonuclease/exonuclease/phosphatase family protein [Rhizobium sp. 2MFCol3.1]